MADIRPFRAIRYNKDKVIGDEVTAPPYDVISPEFKDTLYSRSPYNIIRIDFGRDEALDNEEVNRYSRARDFMGQWLREGVLIQDSEPSVYQYTVKYQHNGDDKTLCGLLALLRIEELGQGVYPHEATHSKPKTDRLNLMKACKGNISPIFSLYRGSKDYRIAIEDSNSAFVAHDSAGASHSLQPISDRTFIASLVDELRNKPVFIADGHHRYEVALEYKSLAEKGLIDGLKEEDGYKPWEYVLVYLVDINHSDITVLPTHRLIKTMPGGDVLRLLDRHFEVKIVHNQPYQINGHSISRILAEAGKNSIGLYMGGNEWFAMKYRGNALESMHQLLRDIDTVILQELILKEDLKTEDIVYEMDIDKALSKIKDGGFKALFMLNPTGIEEVEKAALENLRMPPKSTYFYPKLLTGMVIHSFS